MNLCRVVCVACVVVFAGCSAPGDLRKKSPTLDLNSAKNSKAIVGCIADGLEVVLPGRGIGTRPTSNGYTAWREDVVFGGTETALVVDIIDTPSGSNTRFYSNIVSWKEGGAIKVIRDCQGN